MKQGGNAQQGGGDYQKYYQKYMGNSTQGGDHQKYYGKYMQKSGQQLEDRYAGVPLNAGDCTTMEELVRWRDMQHDQIKLFVPKEFQKSALENIADEFSVRQAELKAAAAAATANNTAEAGQVEASTAAPNTDAAVPDLLLPSSLQHAAVQESLSAVSAPASTVADAPAEVTRLASIVGLCALVTVVFTSVSHLRRHQEPASHGDVYLLAEP